jgi:hypothetical protein
MASIAVRADRLKLITPYQNKMFWIETSKLGVFRFEERKIQITNKNARQLSQKQLPTFAIEAYRSKANVYGEARALVKRADRSRTFATIA